MALVSQWLGFSLALGAFVMGMVVSQGFRAEVKPAAWVATHAADYVVRSLARPVAQESAPFPRSS